jgi:DNA-binding MarR family transcriptional regulator
LTTTTAISTPLVTRWVERYQAFAETYGRLDHALRTELDISVSQAHALIFLDAHGPAGNSEVGHFLRRQAQSMTGLMDRCIARKWVAKKAHPKDRRVVVLSITAKGGDMLARALAVMERVLGES